MSATVRILGLLFLVLGVFGCSKAPPQVPTADRIAVRDVADDIGRASERRDVNGILQHLTVDAELSLVGTQFTAKSYGQYLNKMFSRISNYSYSRSNESMRLAPNGTDVILKFRMSQQYTVDGKPVSGAHDETYFLRKEAGRFKVYKVVAN